MILEDIKADASIGINVRVVNSRDEGHLGRLERVVRWELDVQEEHTSRIRAIVL